MEKMDIISLKFQINIKIVVRDFWKFQNLSEMKYMTYYS